MLSENLSNKKSDVPLNQLHKAGGSIGTPLNKSIQINKNNARYFKEI